MKTMVLARKKKRTVGNIRVGFDGKMALELVGVGGSVVNLKHI